MSREQKIYKSKIAGHRFQCWFKGLNISGFAYRIQLEPGTAIIKDPQNVRDVAPLNLETEFLMRIVHLTDDRGGSAIVENSMKDVAISPTKR